MLTHPNTLIFYDSETGGLEPSQPTIQVAAVAVDSSTPGWPVLELFERKVQFDPDVCDPKALELNHYDPEIWKEEAVRPSQVRNDIDTFFRNHATLHLVSAKGNAYSVASIAGHNIIDFDLPRLKRLFGKKFTPFAWWRALDTLTLASWFFDGGLIGETINGRPDNLKLETLCEFFSIQTEGAHDALADVTMNAKLAEVMVKLVNPRWENK